MKKKRWFDNPDVVAHLAKYNAEIKDGRIHYPKGTANKRYLPQSKEDFHQWMEFDKEIQLADITLRGLKEGMNEQEIEAEIKVFQRSEKIKKVSE